MEQEFMVYVEKTSASGQQNLPGVIYVCSGIVRPDKCKQTNKQTNNNGKQNN